MTTTEKKFKKVRLHKVAKQLNLTIDHLVDHLAEKGYAEALSGKGLNAAITDEEAYLNLLKFYADDKETAERVKEKRAARVAEMAVAFGEQAPEEVPEEVEEAAEAPVEEAVEAPVAEEEVVEEEVVEEPVVEEPVVEEPVVEEPVVEEVVEQAPVEQAEPVAEEAPTEESVAAEAVEAQEPVAAAVGDVTVAKAESKPTEGVIIEALEEGFEEEEEDEEVLTAGRYKLQGTKVIGTIDLSNVEEKKTTRSRRRRKRKRKAAAIRPPPTRSSKWAPV